MTAERPMRICLAINSLRCGGAERVAATLANEWTAAGHHVSLVTLAAASRDFYALDSRIDRRALDVMTQSNGILEGFAANVSRIRRLRQELRAVRPDVIVSLISYMNVLVLVSSAGLRIPVVVSERTDPRMAPLGRVWEALRRLTYRHADALVVQTQSVARWARGLVAAERVVVLPNPIIESCFQVERRAAGGGRARRVVAMGRLSREKGFDVLIDAFDRAASRRPEWTLMIAGEGKLGPALRAQADRTSCADRIQLAGLIARPHELLADTEVFAMSSHFEGFPNALLEGMACGCAVVSTDCPSGPAEIVTSGVDGLLVAPHDAAALAQALESLMASDIDRARLGAAAARSAERFRADAIAERWLQALRSVLGRDASPAVSAADVPPLASER
jgi:glycosyltransferase involved in cell wall biosynthesis